MAKRIPGIQIIGGEHDKVAAANKEVADKQRISLGSISIQCIETPFHTQGHICYLCSEEGSSEKLVFTGDTLFIGGCGRYIYWHILPSKFAAFLSSQVECNMSWMHTIQSAP